MINLRSFANKKVMVQLKGPLLLGGSKDGKDIQPMLSGDKVLTSPFVIGKIIVSDDARDPYIQIETVDEVPFYSNVTIDSELIAAVTEIGERREVSRIMIPK